MKLNPTMTALIVIGVIGMADLLGETHLDGEQREYVATVRECAQQLLETVNAVLEYSALSSGSVKLARAEFSLAALAAAVLDDARPKAEAKGLSVELRIATEGADLVEGDARYLRQALHHLLRNAVKFTHQGGIELGIQHGRGEGWAEIEVRDTGIGIPPAKQRTIFEAFRQVDHGLSRNYSGLGMGLALTHRIIGLMGGEVSVSSDPGQGSTFTLRVPLQPADEAPKPPAAASDATERWKILVVEDNRIAQHVVGRMLESAPCRVTFAGSGSEGIEKALAERFDLILMDLQMPGMDGLAATRAIRESHRCDGVPIVALTANTTDDDREACSRAGMQGFLSKPVRREDLLESISTLLSRAE